MIHISPLKLIHRKGKYGNFENKNEKDLIRISELSNILIYQIVKFKNSAYDISKVQIDGLGLPDCLKVSSNSETRILWIAPNSWLVVSLKLDLINQEEKI